MYAAMYSITFLRVDIRQIIGLKSALSRRHDPETKKPPREGGFPYSFHTHAFLGCYIKRMYLNSLVGGTRIELVTPAV
jgi:hypothetical protein